MSDGLRQEIERLKAQVEALTSERLPRVDRASRRRDRRQVVTGFGLFAVALLVAGTMSASALSGSDTVLSDDIKNGEVHGADINADAVTGSKVKGNSLTGSDIKSGRTLISAVGTIPATLNTSVFAQCPAGTTVTGGGFTQGSAVLVITDSLPTSASTWTVFATNTAATSQNLTVYAVCDSL